jgi:hypothetical protein
MSMLSDLFLVNGSQTVRLYYCERCNHYHCFGTDPDYGWQYLVSVTVNADSSEYVITDQRTTDDAARECVRAIQAFVAHRSG